MFDMRTLPSLFLPEFGTIEFKGTKFSLQHLTPEAVDSLYPEFSGFESYAITRNPYEKAVASYCWLKTKRDKKRFFRFRESRFNKWLNESAILFDVDHTLPQSFWASHVDHQFDISDYSVVTEELSKRIGLPVLNELKHAKKNKLNTKRLVKALSQRSLNAIYRVYEVDFDVLRYPKNSLT